MKTFLTVILTAVLAATATWFVIRQSTPTMSIPTADGPRAAQFYQCSMHSWIKSDKPGRCTICGMELTPVYAGEKPLAAGDGDDILALTQNQIQVMQVQSAEAKTRPLVRTLPVAGMITENVKRHRVLAAYVDGRIDKLAINYLGEEVTEGQPLADIYSPSLLQAEREYRQLDGELRKNTALRLRQMGITPAQIESLDQKPADALTSQILSPVSGTVVSQAVYAGQYVATGAPLFEIADFSTMWFMFRAYEMDLPWLQTGQSVRITTPSLPGKSFTGKITFMDPNLDDATRSTKVRVELPNPPVNGKRELLNRLYADGLVEINAPAVLTVPRSAVIETGPEAVVYRDQGGGGYARTVITTGRRGDTEVEVLSGLKQGDMVVTNGNLLIDGQAELNRSFMPPHDPTAKPPPATTTPPPATLNDPQKSAITEFVKVADTLAAALGTDDLTAFNSAGEAAMMATAAMVKQLSGRDLSPKGPATEPPTNGRDLSPKGPATEPPMNGRDLVPNGPHLGVDATALATLAHAGHFHDLKDLSTARTAYHKFSVAATAVLQPLRKTNGMPDLQVYECGMVDQAIPGAPAKARWIQTGVRDMRNPFFGKEMPDCGVEIKR